MSGKTCRAFILAVWGLLDRRSSYEFDLKAPIPCAPLLHDQKTDEHWLDFGFTLSCLIWMCQSFDVPFFTLAFCFGVILKNPTFVACYHSLKELWLIFKMVKVVHTLLQCPLAAAH